MKTVTVACKIPNGLVIEHGKTVMEDGKPKIGSDNRVIVEGSKKVLINGANSDGAVAGCGMTHNVDADWFNNWIETHAEFEPVKAGAIFALANPNDAAAKAKEVKGEKAGFEPIDANDQQFQAPGVKLETATKE